MVVIMGAVVKPAAVGAVVGDSAALNSDCALEATSNKGIATSNKGITTRNKKLLVAKGIASSSSSLLVTRALLLVARSY